MALVEMEMLGSKFGQFLQFVCSAAPIPIGTLAGLGSSRLITDWEWASVIIGMAPPGYVAANHTLTARADVRLRHVSIAELDVDPNASGTVTSAVAWIQISAEVSALRVGLLAVDIGATPLQWLSPPRLVTERQVPIDAFSPVSSALFLAGEVVTLRVASHVSDSLDGLPLNLLTATNDEWAIRIAGDFFVDQLLGALNSLAAKPPEDMTVEDAPFASWQEREGFWSAMGGMGLLKEDACPGLFGHVDLSVGLHVELRPSGSISGPQPTLDLLLHVASNVSDWDSLRCWLGSGPLASVVLAYGGALLVSQQTGALGFLVGNVGSLVAIAEAVRLLAGEELRKQDVAEFTQFSSTSTSATYDAHRPLPSLVTTSNGRSNGTVSAATTGPHGFVVTGTIQFFGVAHARTFVPDGGALSATLSNKFDCGHKRWLRKVDIQPLLIDDHAILFGSDLGRVPVTIFRSSVATPAHLWSIKEPNPAIAQTVTIEASDHIQAGDSGRVYLHTSAGIRRFDIQPLPAIKAPTHQQSIEAVVRCAEKFRLFSPREEVLWLVDPPPFDYGRPAVRQWLVTFAKLHRGTRLTLDLLSEAGHLDERREFVASDTGEAYFELATSGTARLQLEHTGEQLEGRVQQRWLLPIDGARIQGPATDLFRAGGLVLVAQEGGTLTTFRAGSRGPRLATSSSLRAAPARLRLSSESAGASP